MGLRLKYLIFWRVRASQFLDWFLLFLSCLKFFVFIQKMYRHVKPFTEFEKKITTTKTLTPRILLWWRISTLAVNSLRRSILRYFKKSRRGLFSRSSWLGSKEYRKRIRNWKTMHKLNIRKSKQPLFYIMLL